MSEYAGNITEAGARRRRMGGYVWAIAAAIAGVAMIATHAAPPVRMLIAIPIAMSFIGFLQAREKT